jgi:hypothetical protein
MRPSRASRATTFSIRARCWMVCPGRNKLRAAIRTASTRASPARSGRSVQGREMMAGGARQRLSPSRGLGPRCPRVHCRASARSRIASARAAVLREGRDRSILEAPGGSWAAAGRPSHRVQVRPRSVMRRSWRGQAGSGVLPEVQASAGLVALSMRGPGVGAAVLQWIVATGSSELDSPCVGTQDIRVDNP